jgi:hypothetical protein
MLYGPWIQWLFVIDVALMGGHNKMDIIRGVGHLRSDSIVPLVLCMVKYNIWGTDVVLQVHRNSTNPIENDNISSRLYMRVITYKTLVFMH